MKFSKIETAKKILIYGYGLEGQSSFKFFNKLYPHIKLDIFDQNIKDYKKTKNFNNYQAIIVSPGVDRKIFDKNLTSKLTSNIEIFFNNLTENQRQRIIGISGTKGKSTTTKFCHELLKEAGFKTIIGGNYGKGALDLYYDFVKNKFDYLILELSSYQLENLQVSPGIAIFLGLYPDHLDRHGNLRNYFLAKSHLWRHQKVNDVLIVPKNHLTDLTKFKYEKSIGQIISAPKLTKSNFPTESIFRADHWLENFGTINSLLKILKVNSQVLKKVATTFESIPHRMQFFLEKKNIKFYDDAISTNPDSTLAAINFFDKKLGAIILGGKDRKQDFKNLCLKLQSLNTLIIIYQSEVSDKILKTLKQIKYSNFFLVRDFTEIPKIIFTEVTKNKICLLSTAAPSYDCFKNYEEKGNTFQKIIKKY